MRWFGDLLVPAPTMTLRLGVLISGGGSGMEALVQHQRAAPCGHETVIVVADRPDIEGSARAERLGIPNVIEPVAGSTRAAHERRVEQHLIDANVDLIVCSGWMRLLTPAFVDRWAPRILNIHPSLLPEFPGAHAHRDVLAAGVEVTGCTVHIIDAGMDTGPILAQEQVPVEPDDDVASLAARVKAVEHRLYPEVLDRIADGRLSLERVNPSPSDH